VFPVKYELDFVYYLNEFRKGTQCLGVTGSSFPWGIQIRGPGPPGWGSPESEAVKCAHGSLGTRTRE
jgi:hypothetical protein